MIMELVLAEGLVEIMNSMNERHDGKMSNASSESFDGVESDLTW